MTTGYFKPNEKFSYVHDEKINNLGLPYSLNNNCDKIKYNKNLGYGVNSYIEQLSTEEDSFFSFQFINNTKYDGEGNNKYMPQFIGVDYPRLIKEGTTNGLIPVKPNDNFYSIIYETLLLNGEIEVAVFDCLNYPLCKTDDINNNIKSEIINEKYKSSIIIISSDKYENISPITKKQKMLLIKCIKGTKIDDLENVCKIISSMRVYQDIIYDNDIYKFIEKNEENNFLIPKNGEKIYLNIEIISGNILINSNTTYEYYQNGNKRLYIFSEDKNVNITIKALENSVYTIYNYYDIILRNSKLPVGKNHFLTLNNRLMFKPADLFNSSIYKNTLYYLGIHPLDCDLSVSSFENTNVNNKFFQYIINIKSTDSYYILTNKNPSSTCLCYASFYQLDNRYGIILGSNASQLFSFDKNVKQLPFSYIHSIKNEDINIT